MKVLLLNGSTRKDGCTKDVPPMMVVGGVPAKILKSICAKEQLTKMGKP